MFQGEVDDVRYHRDVLARFGVSLLKRGRVDGIHMVNRLLKNFQRGKKAKCGVRRQSGAATALWILCGF